MDHQAIAEQALGLIDLTSLDETSSAADIDELCARAQTQFGNVAAICVLSKFVAQAAQLLEGTDINVAAIINYPAGSHDVRQVMHEAKGVVADGATEVDLFLPGSLLNNADDQLVSQMISTIRAVTDNSAKLKILLDASTPLSNDQLETIARLALSESADFVGLLAGQDAVDAPTEQSRSMLEAIKKYGEPNSGFKLMGSVSSIDDVVAYLTLAAEIMGPAWTNGNRLRLGASSVLDQINALLDDPAAQTDAGT